MKRVFYQFAVAGLLLTSCLTSCSKDGETGPAGEQGAQGSKGDKGDKGDQGDQGEVGTANVIYSGWLDVEFDENGIGMIQAPKLDAAILNEGSIKVYVNANTESEPFVFSLPCSIPNGEDPAINVSSIYALNTIVLTSNYRASTYTTPEGEKSFQYRYVLIPGGTNALGVNWNDYKQVKNFVGIK